MKFYMAFIILWTGIQSKGLGQLMFSQETVDLTSEQCAIVTLYNSGNTNLNNITIKLEAEFDDIVNVTRKQIHVTNVNTHSWPVQLCGHTPGRTVVSASITLDNDTVTHYLHVTVSKIHFLKQLSSAVGWIYFFAWSVSFYPQIYMNYVRKSVVGLNFDYLALNIIGFLLYSAYNCGLFYISSIQNEYFQEHPKSLNPVMFNDVFFSVHATFITCVTIFQCLIYKRGDQRVSSITRLILFGYFLVLSFCGILVSLNKISWLNFLNYCSYIKLTITMIKYIPQVWMNYKRQSTVGWSIGNILLDFTGGVFSILQMVINAYNFNDWDSFSGDLTKFGLGLFSIAFDILFIIQHYILYRCSVDSSTTKLEVSQKKSGTH